MIIPFIFALSVCSCRQFLWNLSAFWPYNQIPLTPLFLFRRSRWRWSETRPIFHFFINSCNTISLFFLFSGFSYSCDLGSHRPSVTNLILFIIKRVYINTLKYNQMLFLRISPIEKAIFFGIHNSPSKFNSLLKESISTFIPSSPNLDMRLSFCLSSRFTLGIRTFSEVNLLPIKLFLRRLSKKISPKKRSTEMNDWSVDLFDASKEFTFYWSCCFCSDSKFIC